MSDRTLSSDRLENLWNAERGLTAGEVADRLARYGTNDIVESAPHPWWNLVRDTAKDPMLWFFVGTSVLYAAVGQTTEALTLSVAIAPLLGMDVYLHRRTQASTEGLKGRLASTAQALRDGKLESIPAVALVPGDLVVLSTGEAIPADGLFFAAADVQVDESALTGEAYPVPKRVVSFPVGHGTELRFEDIHWGFAGTRLLTGSARLRVAFTGENTLYGEIVHSAKQGTHQTTPLQRAIGALVKVLLFAAILLCVLLAGIRLYQGHGWLDALVSAVTLATAAIPEEFPVVFTFFLGVGVYRLAQRKALVRRAVTVENIGRVSCICSDKTGTITEGRLLLSHLLAEESVDEKRLLRLAAMAARRESGDPMDDAILRKATAAGILLESDQHIATFPFTEDRKRETSVIRNELAVLSIASKGAAEVILVMCDLGSDALEMWTTRIHDLAASAHKVIAVAYREVGNDFNVSTEPSTGFRLAGLLAFEDPVREGVVEAVRACKSAGIHLIMVTGDHPLTAAAVAQEIGLGTARPRVILGDDLAELIGGSKVNELRAVDVIARAKPSQKSDLVKALQGLGEIVAVTGDGVNDVPALTAADIGVAMGERGTRSAREVASIVLLDDNFHTIVAAIGEGRQLFRNLQLSFQYLLVIHIALVLTATLIPFAGYPLLYLPIHVVWVEIVIHPTAMLVFQEMVPHELVPRETVERTTRFFRFGEWVVIAISGLLIAAAVTAGYLRSLEGNGNVEHGRAMAMATFTIASAGLTAALSRLRTRTSRIVCLATLTSSFVLIQTPKIGTLFHLTALHWDDWLLASLAGLATAAIPWGYDRWRRTRLLPAK